MSVFLTLIPSSHWFFFFFFNDTATTEIYTLSLHDALPICRVSLSWRFTAFTAFTSSNSQRAMGTPIWMISMVDWTASAIDPKVHTPADTVQSTKIGRAHLRTPVTDQIPIPPSPLKKKKHID